METFILENSLNIFKLDRRYLAESLQPSLCFDVLNVLWS